MSIEEDELSRKLYSICSTKTSVENKINAINGVSRFLVSYAQSSASESSQGLLNKNKLNPSTALCSILQIKLPHCDNLLQLAEGPSGVDKQVKDDLKLLLSTCNCIHGLSLVHSESQAICSSRATWEVLIDALAICSHRLKKEGLRETENAIPGTSSEQTPRKVNDLERITSASVQLASAILDLSLALLVGNPNGLRVFESEGGLEVMVHLLKRKNLHQEVRIKALELLYFYVLPEKQEDASSAILPTKKFAEGVDADFSYMPSTPQRATIRSHHATKSHAGISTGHNRTKSEQFTASSDSDNGLMDAIQRTPSNRTLEIVAGQRRASRSNLSPTKLSMAKTPRNMTDFSLASKSPRSARAERSFEPSSQMSVTPRRAVEGTLPEVEPDGTRTVHQKKVILGQWMGNVDVLITGMESAGVWKGLMGTIPVSVTMHTK